MSVIYRALRRVQRGKERTGPATAPTSPAGQPASRGQRWRDAVAAAAKLAAPLRDPRRGIPALVGLFLSTAAAVWWLWPRQPLPQAAPSPAAAVHPPPPQAAALPARSAALPEVGAAAPASRPPLPGIAPRPALPGVTGRAAGQPHPLPSLASLSSLAAEKPAGKAAAETATAAATGATPGTAAAGATAAEPPPAAPAGPPVEEAPAAAAPHEEPAAPVSGEEIQVVSTQPLRIERLTSRLRGAVGRGDAAEAERTLAEVERLKGKNHPFALNLRAYWLMSREEFAAAEPLLQEILRRRPDDRDAAINLVVAELRTGRRDAARARFSTLASLYPDDPRLAALAEQFR